VDTFEPGKTLPGCQLLAQLLLNHETEDVPEVHCRIHLCGAKSPRNYFIINLPITGKTIVIIIIVSSMTLSHPMQVFSLKNWEWRGDEACITILLCIVKPYNVMTLYIYINN
jgi:hypothetical protein